jgi:RHS repeat-associated protein
MFVLAGQGANEALAASSPARPAPLTGAGPVTPPPPAGSAAAAALAAQHHLGAGKVPTVPGHFAGPVAIPSLVRPGQLGRRGRAPAWPAAGAATVALRAQKPAQSEAGRWVRVAGLPVQVAAAGDSTVRAVRVGVATHAQSVAAGSDGTLLEVTRADSAALAGNVKIRVNYAGFAGEYGAGYGVRLALFEMPACALTTPSLRTCRGMAPVGSANNPKTSTITATVNAAPAWEPGGAAQPYVYAIASTTSGGAGDYKATSLSPSSLWQVGLQTGDFTWSYPLRVPPSIGGKAPSLSLSYDSGSTDGETAQSNSQPGQLGEGFSLAGAGGFIERKYTSCGDLINAGNTNTGQPTYEQTGDQCWDGLNAYISSAGHSGQLIYDPSDSSWHLSSDDGSTVRFLSGADNGAYNGSYWEVIAPDGTQYYYGLNKLPGYGSGDQVTNSVWTMPVFGIRSGDPCNTPGSYTQSVCTNMPWRWNLDLVVDPNGNATSYFYNPETNYYATDSYAYLSNSTPVTHYGTAMQYDTGGTLTDIYYGMQDLGGQPNVYTGEAFHVSLWYSGRCSLYNPSNYTNSSTISTCNNTLTRVDWPDTPWDLFCASASGCTGSSHEAPAFFDAQMLYKVKTELIQGQNSNNQPVPETVDTWTLGYDWLAGDVNWDLVLATVQHEGWVGGSGQSLSPAEFGWTGMNNRVNYGESFPLMYRYRLTSVISETGARTHVAYNAGQCNASELFGDSNISGNNLPCFPQKWTGGDFGGNPTNLWYYKYTVAAVTVSDPTGGGQVMPTTYQYCNSFHCGGSTGTGANWHYDTDNDLVPAKDKSWAEWRGYNYVRVTSGTGADQSETDYTYLTGMDSDPLPCSTCNSGWTASSVTIQPQDSLNALQAGIGNNANPVTDSNALNGFLLEKIVWNGTHSTEWAGTGTVSDQVNWPWVSPATATSAVQPWGESNYAEITDTAETDTYTPLSTFGQNVDTADNEQQRQIKTVYTWNPVTGALEDVSSLGDTAIPGEATCSNYAYPAVALDGLLTYPNEVTVTEGYCSARQQKGVVTISDVKFSYDGQSFGAPATQGNITETDILAPSTTDQSGNHWVTKSRESYDSYGRVTQDENSAGFTTWYTYSSQWTPGSASSQEYATTQETVQSPLTASTSETTTTDIYAEWGLPYDVIDANNLRTDYAYDALGDLTDVWLPGETGSTRSGDAAPNYAYAYNINQATPSSVETTTLAGPSDTPVTSYQIFDSLLRLRQTQSPAEGRAGGMEVTDTEYDSLGHTLLTNNPYTVSTAPSGNLFLAAQAAVPSSTVLSYDGAGRETKSAFYSDGTLQWNTQYQYPDGDETTEIPPSGGTTTTTYTDGLGRPLQIEQFQSNGDYSGTAYAYSYDTTGGTMMTVTDPGGENWSFTDNRLGDQTYATYPDTGTSNEGWNDLGQLTTATDPAGHQISYNYDGAGRKTAEYNTTNGGEASSDQLAKWTYDTASLAGGSGTAVGQLAAEDSYVNGSGSGGEDYKETIGGYDDSYNPTSETWTIPQNSVTGSLGGQSYTFNYTYNADGSLNTSSFPADGGMSSETLHYGYDNLGSPYSLWSGGSDYVQRAAYTPAGLTAEVDLGSGPSSQWSRLLNEYDTATQRLTKSRVQQETPSANWSLTSDTSYSYDPYGNITSAGESVANEYQCYQYDYLDRLTAAWSQSSFSTGCSNTVPSASGIGGAAPYEETLAYDTGGTANGSTQGTTGRIRTNTLITGPATAQKTTTSYTYPAYTAAEPHAPASASVTVGSQQPSTTTYTWNGNSQPGDLSNITSTPYQGSAQQVASYQWNGSGATPGQLSSTLTGSGSGAVTTSYRYDADGNLLLEQDGSVSVLFLPGEDLTASGSAVSATRYYLFGGRVVAAAVPNSGGGSKLVSWLFSDQVGTATTAISASTQAVTQRYYTPFGVALNSVTSWPGTRGFVDGTTDATTGLTNLGAREYTPALAGFLSPDPVLDVADPLDLDPYDYSENNPVIHSDPTGLSQGGSDPNPCGEGASANCGSDNAGQNWNGGTGAGDNDGDYYGYYADQGSTPPPPSPVAEHLADIFSTEVAPSATPAAMSSATGAGCWGRYAALTGCVPSQDSPMDGGSVSAGTLLTLGAIFLTVINFAQLGLDPVTDGFEAADLTALAADETATAAEDAGAAAEDEGAEAASCGGESFTAGTKVLLASGAAIAISKVKPGDKVLAMDLKAGTAKAETITAVLVHYDTNRYDLRIAGKHGSLLIRTTSNHLFWDPYPHYGWIPAKSLKPGMRLKTPDGQSAVVVGGSVPADHDGWMWDLTIPGNNDHDFYVFPSQADGSDDGAYHVTQGEVAVLVHNDSCGVTPRDGGGEDANGNFISGSADGQNLAGQLRGESANSVFNENGSLSQGAIDNSQKIIDGEDINNPAVREYFESNGGAAQWGKYSTGTYQSPYGPFQVHYYMNEETGEIMEYDYKAVMNRR